MSEKNHTNEPSKRAQQQSLPLSWDADGPAPGQESETPTKKAAARQPAAERAPDSGDDDAHATDDAKQPQQASKDTKQQQPAPEQPEPEAADETPGAATGMPLRSRTHSTDRPALIPEDADVVRLGDVETSLGQTLLEARGARNMSTTQVSQKTKIPKDFIEAVEADQTERLPPPVYTRSYISQLCREYEIAPESLLEEYERSVGRTPRAERHNRRFILGPETDESPTVQYRPRIQREVVTGKMLQTVSRFAVLGALVLLVALVLIAVIYQQVKNYRMRQQDVAPTEAGQLEAPAVDVEEYIAPQQLPLVELDVPGTDEP